MSALDKVEAVLDRTVIVRDKLKAEQSEKIDWEHLEQHLQEVERLQLFEA